MTNAYIESEDFKGIDYTKTGLPKADYDNCTFFNCNFSEMHLSQYQFIECHFIDCNFSLTKVKDTSFKNVHFKDCKLVGINFGECDPFLLELKFTNCQLNLASFYKLKLKNSVFTNCQLHEVDFTETDLSNTLFDTCDFKLAVFEHTILEKANFTTSYHYSIDPEINSLKKAVFSKDGLSGLLEKYQLEIE